jgi:hypothetical protein
MLPNGSPGGTLCGRPPKFYWFSLGARETARGHTSKPTIIVGFSDEGLPSLCTERILDAAFIDGVHGSAINGRLWKKLPASFTTLWPVRSYGNSLHHWLEGMVFAAGSEHVFLRNRPQLELIRRLIERRAETDLLRVAVLGCSTGVEAYGSA